MLARKLTGSVLAIATALTLSSCAQEEYEPVVIVADPSNPEQRVLAEIYRQVIELDGRKVGIVGVELADDTEKLEILQSGEANLGIFCSGSLVEAENPDEEANLRARIADGNGANLDVQHATYDAAAGTLPGNLMTLDPSPAQGCEPEPAAEPPPTAEAETKPTDAPKPGDEAKPSGDNEPQTGNTEDPKPDNPPKPEAEALPRNIMPVFRVGLFDRGVRQAIHKVTRALSTEDLHELVEQTEKEGDPSGAVNDWMLEKTGMGSELQRIVEEGEARDA